MLYGTPTMFVDACSLAESKNVNLPHLQKGFFLFICAIKQFIIFLQKKRTPYKRNTILTILF